MKNPEITLTPQQWAAIRWIFEVPAADGVSSLFNAEARTSITNWSILAGAELLSICFALMLFATPSLQSFGKVIFLHRRPNRPLADLPTLIAGVLGALTLVVTIIFNLYPRK